MQICFTHLQHYIIHKSIHYSMHLVPKCIFAVILRWVYTHQLCGDQRLIQLLCVNYNLHALGRGGNVQ